MIARERGYGTVVKGPLTEEEKNALSGNNGRKPLEIDNRFGQMYAWFSRVDGWSGNVLAGADMYAFARTAREVGGDFYDCLIIDDDRLAIPIGDVSGKGGAVLLYTDGVTEAVSPDNAFFGEERFMASVRAHAPYTAARTLVDEAVNAVDAFVEGHEQFDDLTLLALVRNSEPIELVRQLASDLHYRREARRNILVIRASAT